MTMLLKLSVEIEAESSQEARLLASRAGFEVKRVTAAPITLAATTEPHPFVRASARLDMPDDLDRDERKAYRKGYAAACLTYHRKHGNPALKDTRANEWSRHPLAHTKGLAELAAYRKRTEAYLADRAARLGSAVAA